MVEIDTSARRVNTFGTNQVRPSIPFLLTQERIQALDILMHLISNSSDSIIFCGPEGVGKTRLLKVLQNSDIPSCRFLLINDSNELTFGRIQDLLEKFLKDGRSSTNDRIFTSVHREKGISTDKSVIIIDNAGALAPGLIAEILNYADTRSYVCLIFVLTHDELQLKNKSDQAIENCHIVELPPLTEKQCGEFMQHILAKTSGGVITNALSESAVEEIYQHSHGLPSRIIAGYSAPPKKPEENPTRILVLAVLSLIVVALVVQWLSTIQTITELKVPTAVEGNTTAIARNQPFISLPIPYSDYRFLISDLQLIKEEMLPWWNKFRPQPVLIYTAPGTGAIPDATTLKNENTAPNPVAAVQSDLKNPGSSEGITQLVDDNLHKTADADVEEKIDASAWLSSQPGTNFSIQLMVLSKQQSIFDVMKKYPSLKKDIRYIRRLIQNKEKFVLLYGSFPNAVTANKAKQKLPAEFRKAITRKITAIHEEFK